LSQSYGPPQPVTGIASPFLYVSLCVRVALCLTVYLPFYLITSKFIRLCVSCKIHRTSRELLFCNCPRLTVATCSASVYIYSTDNTNEVYKTSSVSEVVNNATFMQTLDSSILMTGYIIMPQFGPISAFLTRYQTPTHITI
jgi:hypothetical protein